MFGIPIRALLVIVPVVLVLIIGAAIAGRMQGWDARGRLEAANRTAEIALAAKKATEAQIKVVNAARENAERTHERVAAVDRSVQASLEEIRNAARAEDLELLSVAIEHGVERVWNDAGDASGGASADPGASGNPGRVPERYDA